MTGNAMADKRRRVPVPRLGTRRGVKQNTEADPSSIMAENSHLISKMPERETGLPNTYLSRHWTVASASVRSEPGLPAAGNAWDRAIG